MNGSPSRAGVIHGFTALALALWAVASPAADDLPGLFTEGTPGLEFRWRLENVDQDPFTREATGIPLRARIHYASGQWNGWSLFAEYDHVFDLGADGYNEGGGNTPDRAAYPVIADPAGGDLNQAYVKYASGKTFLIKGGRQRIIYDNARLIGNVGWRQNEQTYDGLAVEATTPGGFEVRGAWIAQVNRIFGDDVPDGRHDMDTWLLNVARALGGAGKLVAYAYRIDDEESPSASNQTLGLRFTGSRDAGDATLDYTLEYAWQEDAAHNPLPYEVPYWRAELSAALGPVTPYAGYESLGGDAAQPGQAFRTPLATLHAFNGWADKFLATPDAGLLDRFAGRRGELGNWSWNVVYHDFSAESGSADFGSEFDASLSRNLLDNVGLLIKAARFDGDHPDYGDTTKLWLQLTARFPGG